MPIIIIIRRNPMEPKKPVNHQITVPSPISRGQVAYKTFATRNQYGGMFGLENQIVLN